MCLFRPDATVATKDRQSTSIVITRNPTLCSDRVRHDSSLLRNQTKQDVPSYVFSHCVRPFHQFTRFNPFSYEPMKAPVHSKGVPRRGRIGWQVKILSLRVVGLTHVASYTDAVFVVASRAEDDISNATNRSQSVVGAKRQLGNVFQMIRSSSGVAKDLLLAQKRDLLLIRAVARSSIGMSMTSLRNSMSG